MRRVRWGSESTHAVVCKNMPQKVREKLAPNPRKRKRESENAEDDSPSRTIPSPGYRSTLARRPTHPSSVPRPGDMRSDLSYTGSYAPSRPPPQTDISPAAMYPYTPTPDFGFLPQLAGPSSAPSVPHYPSYYPPSMPSFMPTMPLGGRTQESTVPLIPSPSDFYYGPGSFDVSELMPQDSTTPASSLSEAQMRQLMNYDYFGSPSNATGSGSTEPDADSLDPSNFSF